MTDPHRITAPEVNTETKAFWDAANENRLLLKRCLRTGKAFFPPRTHSPFTGLSETDWIEASGAGIVYSFSILTRQTVTHCIAYITLEEGPTVLSNITMCDTKSVYIGQAVQAIFVASTSGQKVPMFKPVEQFPSYKDQ